ncbi:MAG: hypothetical protein ACHQIG_14080 [Acidimicrobiia bacterium]
MSEAEHITHDEMPPVPTGLGSGLATVYDALDRLVAAKDLVDAVVVVDVAPLGRQVLRAGRKPLRDDEHLLFERAPGLYVEPADGDGADDPIVADLMVMLTELALRHDVARLAADGP